ncbi:IclR family transcriptional regulator [Mycolicibacterium sp. GCM10028919]|uniref:IclR family transcriptional regulator n=1 Tax=Mycolicibacterium sp. GCM10028919 TaxID=3273401 RepID=UPI00361341EE
MAAPSPVNAVEKVLAVLEALAEHRRLTDLARTTGLPKSTVHRILQTMVDRGFAAFDEDNGYSPGPRMVGLSGRTIGEFGASLGAEPVLRRLQERFSATVHMAVLTGDEAVYVRKLEGNKPYRMVSRVGMAIPLHCTGIGKALLAGMPEEEVAALVQRTGLPRRTPRTLTTLDALLADLKATRERGWARDMEENEEGIVCAGAAIRDHSGRMSAAISVSQLRSDPTAIDLSVLGPELAAAAVEVSTGLGTSSR